MQYDDYAIMFYHTDIQRITILQGLFVKDTNSMAFYNTTGSSHVVLQIKERGGRKK